MTAGTDLRPVPPTQRPMALADLHRELSVGARARIVAPSGGPHDVDDGRVALRDLVVGAGFEVAGAEVGTSSPGDAPAPGVAPSLAVDATRARSLPDTVGPGMRLLVCGLNPSLHAADAGVGYAGPGNRFWPALAEAGLAPPPVLRDPAGLLRQAGIGMTDLVKRATPRAAELTAAEHRAGLARVERLCGWLAPEAVVLVGLAGWRAAVDRRAAPGWQARRLGPSPVYLMPSTSGLNAATRLGDLVDHLRAAAAGPGPGR